MSTRICLTDQRFLPSDDHITIIVVIRCDKYHVFTRWMPEEGEEDISWSWIKEALPSIPLTKVFLILFLGPRGPLVLPLVDPYTRPPIRAKNLDTYIQANMPHESSGDSSNQPDGPMGSPRHPP